MNNTLSLSVLALVALRLVACSGGSGASDEIVVTPGTPAAQRNDPATPPVTNGPSSACEDFGALSATSLVATLDTSGAAPVEATTVTLAGRPVTTKVRVLAAGEPSTLIGGSAVLGAAENVSYATCTHCLVVVVGCTTDCSAATLFYPRSGSATFTALASAAGQPFAGTFKDVELEQVTLDPVTLASTPVPGGACLRIPSLVFSATTQLGAPGGDADAGGSAPDVAPDDAGDGGGGSKSGGGGGGGGRTNPNLTL